MKDSTKINKSVEGRPDYWGVLDIKRKFDEHNLVVQEDFQRRDVWDHGKKSRLIESMLRGIPIPSIYVEEVDEGTYVVIDGQQRINSIIEFLKGELKLRGLSLLEELTNKRYNNIQESCCEITVIFVISIFISPIFSGIVYVEVPQTAA